MTAVLESSVLTKRYGRRQALTDCTLSVPAGVPDRFNGPMVVPGKGRACICVQDAARSILSVAKAIATATSDQRKR